MFFIKHTAHKKRLDYVAKLYIAYKFFSNLFFAYPIFYQFARQTISPLQVGIFFSTIGLVGFLAEVPTGVIADKHGRKLSGLIGTIVLSIAPLLIFFGHTFSAYLFAACFYGFGRAFLNGSLESLVYDHKNVTKTMYRRVNTLEISYSQLGILVSAALGGLLFSTHESLPFLVDALAGVVSFTLVAFMKEQHKEGYIAPTSSHRQHFIESMRYLFATSYLRVFIFMAVSFSVMLGMCIQFVNEAAMIEHGLHPETRGFLISGAGVATLIILHGIIFRFIKRDTERIVYLIGGAFAAYVLMSLGNLPLFLVGYLVWCCLNATSSFMRLMVHERIPSSHRSTIMSNFKALAILVGLSASTLTGFLVQQTKTPRSAYVVFSEISGFLLLPCAYWLIVQLRRGASENVAEGE